VKHFTYLCYANFGAFNTSASKMFETDITLQKIIFSSHNCITKQKYSPHTHMPTTKDSSHPKNAVQKERQVPTKILRSSCRCCRERSGCRSGGHCHSRGVLYLAELLDALPLASVVVHLEVSLNGCCQECIIWLWHGLLVFAEFYCHNVTQMWAWVI